MFHNTVEDGDINAIGAFRSSSSPRKSFAAYNNGKVTKQLDHLYPLWQVPWLEGGSPGLKVKILVQSKEEIVEV